MGIKVKAAKSQGSLSTRIRNTIKAIALGTGVGLLILSLFTSTDVFGRYLLAKPVPGSYQVGELLLPYIVFFTFGYALVTGAHVRVTLVVDRFPSKIRSNLEIVMLILESAFLVYLTYAAWVFFWKSFVIREIMISPVNLPWWFGKLAMPLGVFVFLVAMANEIANKILRRDPQNK